MKRRPMSDVYCQHHDHVGVNSSENHSIDEIFAIWNANEDEAPTNDFNSVANASAYFRYIWYDRHILHP